MKNIQISQFASLVLNFMDLFDSIRHYPLNRHARQMLDPTLNVNNEVRNVVLEEKEKIDMEHKFMRGIQTKLRSYCSDGRLLLEVECRLCSFYIHMMVDVS